MAKKGSYRYIYHYFIENILKSTNISWECIKRKYQINNLVIKYIFGKINVLLFTTIIPGFCEKKCHTYDVFIHASVKYCPIYIL